MKPGMTRREWIKLTLLSSAALPLGGCRSCREPAKSRDWFEILEALRQAVRESPDNLPAMAEKLVAKKDPAEILAFVRDRIATYPERMFSIADAGSRMRWGVRGTLRSGAGTPREKAELAAELYRRAGFQAEVVVGKLREENADARKLLFAPVKREFKPAPLEPIVAHLNLAPATPSRQAPDQAPATASTLLAELEKIGAMPKEAFDLQSKDVTVPLVKVTINGETKYANPIVPGAQFGESYTQRAPATAGKAVNLLPIKVELSMATTLGQEKRLKLVEGSWDAADVVGRQLWINFAPAYELEELFELSAEQVNSFIPSLVLRGVDLTNEQAAKLSFSGGKIVTTWGDVIEEDKATGEISVNGKTVGVGTASPADEARVKTLTVQAQPVAFPTVRLKVKALDEQGKPVSGLTAASFTVREADKLVIPVLQENRSPKPKVLLLFDVSDSIPEEFRKEGAAKLASDLVTRLAGKFPDVLMRIATVDWGKAGSQCEWTDNVAQIEEAARKMRGYGSDLWGTLADANKFSPTVIVYITDGDETDKPNSQIEGVISRGAPVILMGVGKAKQQTLDRMASLSNGSSFTVSQPEEAVRLAGDFVQRVQTESYSLIYSAPVQGPTERKVNLSLRNTPASAQATYQVPPEDKRSMPPQICGIYLTVTVGQTEVTRTLAGYEGEARLIGDPSRTTITPPMLAEVRDALFGSAVLSFEGAAPTHSVLLDDVLTSKLEWKPFIEALKAGEKEKWVAMAKEGLPQAPSKLIALNQPLPDVGQSKDASLTFEDGLRVVLHTERPQFGKNSRLVKSDILPLSNWVTVTETPAKSFGLTMERTARLSYLEAALFKTSAAKNLTGVEVKAFKPYSSVEFSQEIAKNEAAMSQWRSAFRQHQGLAKCAPASGKPVSFWAIEPKTGAALAVLWDGSGGGSEEQEVADTFNRAANVLDALDKLNSLGGGGLAMSVWLELERTKMRKLRGATIMLATMKPLEGAEKKSSDNALGDLGDKIRDMARDKFLDSFGLGTIGDTGIVAPKGVADAYGRIAGVIGLGRNVYEQAGGGSRK